jgi:uncharacterized membrane protein
VFAVLLLALTAALVAPRSQAGVARTTTLSEVRAVLDARCVACHSSTPVHPAFPAAPLGVMFDNDEQVLADAERIHAQTVVTRVMPIGNLTAMTDEERQIIDQWYRALGSEQ